MLRDSKKLLPDTPRQLSTRRERERESSEREIVATQTSEKAAEIRRSRGRKDKRKETEGSRRLPLCMSACRKNVANITKPFGYVE